MKRLVIAVLVTLALNAGVTVYGAEASHAEVLVTPGTIRHCTPDTVNGGEFCGWLHYNHGGRAAREAWSLVNPRTLPLSAKRETRVVYLGWSHKNLGDGITLHVIRSKQHPERWHLFRVIVR